MTLVTQSDQYLSKDSPVAVFLETFTKHSVFYKSVKTGKYHKKLAIFKVKGYNKNKKQKVLGELQIDLANFVGYEQKELELGLTKSVPNAKMTMEISISQNFLPFMMNIDTLLQI